jgi:hypothetical protein
MNYEFSFSIHELPGVEVSYRYLKDTDVEEGIVKIPKVYDVRKDEQIWDGEKDNETPETAYKIILDV